MRFLCGPEMNHVSSECSAGGCNGSQTLKVVPVPTLDSTLI